MPNTILDWTGNTIKAKGFVTDAGVVIGGTPSAAIADITVAVTSGVAPTPNGAITIAVGGTPTVVELFEYCTELKAKLEAVVDVLAAHDLTL